MISHKKFPLTILALTCSTLFITACSVDDQAASGQKDVPQITQPATSSVQSEQKRRVAPMPEQEALTDMDLSFSQIAPAARLGTNISLLRSWTLGELRGILQSNRYSNTRWICRNEPT